MTTSVRFCLSSYDPLKWDFIDFKMRTILNRKRNADMDVVNDVMYVNVLLHMWSYNFYDTTLSTKYKRCHMIIFFISQ